MFLRPVLRGALFSCLVLFTLSVGLERVAAQQKATAAANPGELTVDRIFSQPSLSGHLTGGVAWVPGKNQVSFFQPKQTGKDAKPELWTMDPSTGERALLVSADKLENVLLSTKTKDSQATGAGRRPPSQYLWAPGGNALFFVGPHALAWFDLQTQQTRVLASGEEDLSDAKISPDGRFVSFVRNHNLWLVGTADGKERALTTGGTEEVRKGELDWVYPEELELFTAYWWAPDSSAIAYLEMDERKVTQFPLVDFESSIGEAELQRYPVPGGLNPGIRVVVAQVAGNSKERVMDVGAETDIYIPRVKWLPDSKHLAIQRLNRAQTILAVLLSDAATGKSSTILSEKDAYWINVSNDLYFFKDGKRFLWSSERTGYRHLYLYDFSAAQPLQLTKGDWEVSQLERVDEKNAAVYFTAKEKSPMESHLYRVGLDGSGFTRITKEDGTHAVNVAPDAVEYLDTYSNSSTPPRQDFYRADGSKLATLNENKVADLAGYHLSPVEFFSIKSHDGMSLNCLMIKPPNFDPSKKYPVLVYTYGGPHAQVVVNEWMDHQYLWHQMMAQQGYIIFSLDNRGSAGRGHVFEEPIHYRFGAQELSDQRDGGVWLKSQPYVDPDRIGIHGWSYGGHMTLHAIFEAPQVFKAAFAGSPVTDWHFYDTIYTERYIGLLPLHEESYQESSPIKNAEKLKGKLLIAYGTGDDNVHSSNTLALIDDLIKAGKYVEIMTFPGRGHGASDVPAQRVLWNRVTKFFLDNL